MSVISKPVAHKVRQLSKKYVGTLNDEAKNSHGFSTYEINRSGVYIENELGVELKLHCINDRCFSFDVVGLTNNASRSGDAFTEKGASMITFHKSTGVIVSSRGIEKPKPIEGLVAMRPFSTQEADDILGVVSTNVHDDLSTSTSVGYINLNYLREVILPELTHKALGKLSLTEAEESYINNWLKTVDIAIVDSNNLFVDIDGSDETYLYDLLGSASIANLSRKRKSVIELVVPNTNEYKGIRDHLYMMYDGTIYNVQLSRKDVDSSYIVAFGIRKDYDLTNITHSITEVEKWDGYATLYLSKNETILENKKKELSQMNEYRNNDVMAQLIFQLREDVSNLEEKVLKQEAEKNALILAHDLKVMALQKEIVRLKDKRQSDLLETRLKKEELSIASNKIKDELVVQKAEADVEKAKVGVKKEEVKERAIHVSTAAAHEDQSLKIIGTACATAGVVAVSAVKLSNVYGASAIAGAVDWLTIGTMLGKYGLVGTVISPMAFGIGAAAALSTALYKFRKPISNALRKALDGFTKVAKTVFNGIRNAVTKSKSFVRGCVDTVIGKVGNFVGGVVNSVSSVISGGFSSMCGWLGI